MSRPAPHPDPWVVVVNYGLHQLIRENLTAGEDPVTGLPVVVVDNWHSQTEREAIADLCASRRWTLVPNESNPGFAAAVNAGVRAARAAGATTVVLLNPDARASADQLRALAADPSGDPEVLVSPVVVGSDGSPYFHGSRLDLRSGRIRGRPRPGPETPSRLFVESAAPWQDWISGCCLVFSVEVWARAGGLDEDYFLYWEDVDFSLRCVAVGARLCVRTDVVIVHDEGASHGIGGSRARSATYYRYNCRNRLLFASKHLGPASQLRWVLRTPAESRRILLRGGRRQLLESPRPLLATLKGSAEGIGWTLRRLLPARLRRR